MLSIAIVPSMAVTAPSAVVIVPDAPVNEPRYVETPRCLTPKPIDD